MCTHNQCFRAKKEKYYNFSSENEHFYSREILLYIAWACLRNDRFEPYLVGNLGDRLSLVCANLFCYQTNNFLISLGRPEIF